MAKIRFGVVGVGGMGRSHVGFLAKIPAARLTAVCDIVEKRATAAAQEFDAKPFVDYRDLVASRLVDAVIVATPHYAHPPIGTFALEHGVHVICEKPLGVTLTPVDRLIRAARKSGCLFAVMFQFRTRGIYQKAREIIRSGQLGDVRRLVYIAPCYRSQAYYDSDPWRGTWADEGGGVLVNQAPHYTDLLWWLGGNPSSVTGKIGTRLHRIEVEDEAEALLDYPNGATGYYYTSTTQVPADDYLRVVGDKATLLLTGSTLRLAQLNSPLARFTRESKEVWGSPKFEWRDVPFREAREYGHRAIIANFIQAIRRGTPLISPGVEGIHQVEISCAIVLSALEARPVALPVVRAEYDRLMARLIRESRVRKAARPGARKEAVKVFH